MRSDIKMLSSNYHAATVSRIFLKFLLLRHWTEMEFIHAAFHGSTAQKNVIV